MSALTPIARPSASYSGSTVEVFTPVVPELNVSPLALTSLRSPVC